MLILALYAGNAPADPSGKYDQLVKFLLTILATLVPAAVASIFKWAQDHDLQRRKADLIERISKLAKNIADIPELSSSDNDTSSRVRAALNLELESALRDLNFLQTHTARHVIGVSSLTSKLRAALLWYRPSGFAAWTLHLAFYATLILLFVISLGLIAVKDIKDASESGPAVYIVIYVILGIPPLILRYFAARIHRRQCAQSEARVLASADGPVAA